MPLTECCFIFSKETVADVDEVFGEMFLEEIQPTEGQLIVGSPRHCYTHFYTGFVLCVLF